MNREQFLLTKLSEECAEVSQRALKQIQFGRDQVQKGTEVKDGTPAPDKEIGFSNARRLTNELIDLLAIAALLQDAGEVLEIPSKEFDTAKATKIVKLNKYLKFSQELGTIPKGFSI